MEKALDKLENDLIMKATELLQEDEEKYKKNLLLLEEAHQFQVMDLKRHNEKLDKKSIKKVRKNW